MNDDQTTDEMPLTGSTPSSGNEAPMRLRADAPRVTRLSRKVLAGLGVIASAGVGGALIFALQDRVDNAAPAELFSTENRTPADGLQRLPRDYSGVPQPNIPPLGPPLPGDLADAGGSGHSVACGGNRRRADPRKLVGTSEGRGDL